MTVPVLRIGTRGSALALAQSGQIGAAVAAATGCIVDLVRIRTEGDVNTGPLAAIGGTGVFVTAVRAALLAGDVDIVVHSFKDLPTAPAEDLALAAVPLRENPFDALCARAGRPLAELPPGARIGTGSPRRSAQLLAARPDLKVEPLRGNVDTRLATVADGDLDAVVLAYAGLARLNRTSVVTEVLEPPTMLPAAAQGALAVECRDGETAWYTDALGLLDDPPSRWTAVAERALLGALEAGCSAPVGAWARLAGDVLTLDAAVIAVDGTAVVRATSQGVVTDDASAGVVGRRLAAELTVGGAADLLGLRG